MDELLRLLGLAANIGSMSDAELETYRNDLRVAAAEVLAGDDVDDEALAALDRAAVAVEQVEEAMAVREQEREERETRRQGIAERILGQTSEEAEGEGEGEETPETVETPDVDAPDAETAEPEGLAAAVNNPGTTGSATRRPERVAVERVRSRRPDIMEAQRARLQQRAGGSANLSLVAAANLGSIQAGTRLEGDTLAMAMIEAYRLSEGYRGPRVKVPVARVGFRDPAEMFGEERTLRIDSPESNTAKVERVTSQDAITAAGGICAPTPVRYDLPAVGVDDRPVRDDLLTRFGADRGGIRTLPPPELTDFTGAVTAWTEANDREPSNPTTKPCLTMTCPSAEETLVDAITRCIRIGNFRARFFPEQVSTWLNQAAVWHARFAESRLLTGVGTGSTQITVGQGLGAAIDVLTTLDRAVAAFRSRRRLPRSYRLRLGVPFWLIDLMRADLTREAPGGSMQERLAAADSAIESFMTTRGVNLTMFLDGETGQIFGPQGDGPLIGWPSTCIVYLFPEGSWLFLDGGTLDLGIIRDSTLTGTNDYLVFAETFENEHFHGIESQRITMDLCPDGSTAGPNTSFDPCSTGS